MNEVEAGLMFYKEIEAKRKMSPGEWKWQHQLYREDGFNVSAVCRLAGCWCDYPSGMVTFYSNHKHPAHGGGPIG